MLQLKMLPQPTKLQPKKLLLLKTPWLLKKLLLRLTKQPLKLLLQTKLLHLHLQTLPLPSKLRISGIPFWELDEGQPGNRLALFLVCALFIQKYAPI
jgi:hypothetical protein